MSEGYVERVISQQILLLFVEMGMSDPVIWSFAQLKKYPSCSNRCDYLFFRSKYNLNLGVERLYRFIDNERLDKKTISFRHDGGYIKSKAGFLWRSLCSTRGCQIAHAVTRKIWVKLISESASCLLLTHTSRLAKSPLFHSRINVVSLYASQEV